MDRALSHKVTLVSTPPGYGKSTLVSQWLQATPHPSAWISLDAADNDPVTFARYLIEAIDGIDDSLTTGTRRLVEEQRGVPVRVIIDTLVSELASATRPFVLVLDDLHAIHAPDLLEGIGRLITYAPPALRLVLITRSDPRLPLMRLRAHGELFSIGASDLAFTPEETQSLLCDRYGLPIDDAQLAALQSWSEGWPLGLMLLGQALQERAQDQVQAIIDRFASNPDFIADYLWRELIQRQPEERQRFLLQTSILDQFNAQACNAVTGRSDAEAMLTAIAEENLFLIPLGERRSWHRYHHLFEDVLRERLARLVPHDEIRELHARASRWYRSEGLIEEAAAHAIKGQDWDLAVEILTPLCSELFRQERLVTVRAWLDALPSEVIQRDPQLSSEYAWALMRGGYAARSRPFTEAAEKKWRVAGDKVGIGRILILRALEDFYLHENARGIERCQQSLALLPEAFIDDRARLFAVLGYLLTQKGELQEAEAALMRCRLLARETGSVSILLLDMNMTGLCLVARGAFPEAETLFQRVIATGDEWHDTPVLLAHLLLGSLYLDQYRLDLAEQTLERALELSERLSVRLHPIRIHHLLGEIAWARHDPETALAAIERSIVAAGPDGFSVELRHTRAQLARIWMKQGKFNLARSWANELNLNFEQPPEFSHVDEYLVALEFLARDGQTRLALVSLDLAIANAQEKGHRHNLLNMLLLKSIFLASQGKSAESHDSLSLAIEIGYSTGHLRPFFAYGSELEEPLQHLNKSSDHARFIRRLLEQIRLDRQHGESPEELANPLSKRQTEIMRLVAAGQSNRDIADQLFISEQTVKKHLSMAFTRLEVSSRTQAIDACRRLNIL